MTRLRRSGAATRRRLRPAGAAALAVAVGVGVGVGGCGLSVQGADLFLLTRTGEGPALTLLPSDSGSIRCNGGKSRPLSDALLIDARDLAIDLGKDATHKLTIARQRGTVFYYRIRLQQGAIAFPDVAARGRKELSAATLFAAQAAQSACGLAG